MYGKDTICALQIGSGPAGQVTSQGEQLFRLDNTTDEYAIIYQCQKAMTIDEIAINFIQLAGTPTYQISIQGVSVATGDPDGTIFGGASPASVQFAPTANGLQWITLDNSHTVAKGDIIALVIEDGTSGTNPDASNRIDIVAHDVQLSAASIPYALSSTDTGSTWAPLTADVPSFGFRNSGTTNNVMGNPVDNWFKQISLTTAVDDILGQGFMLPASLGKRVQIHGININYVFASTEFELGVWDSDAGGTEMSAVAVDDDITGSSSSIRIGFFAPVWLDTEHLYYAGARHTETGGNLVIYEMDALTDDNLSAFHGYPNNNFAKNNGSAWTKDTGAMAQHIMLLVSSWDHDSDVIQPIGSGVSMP